jgi:hypothetical protein
VTAAFELGAKLRGQDESTLGVQRVLVLANKSEHRRSSHGLTTFPHSVTHYTT